MTPESRYSLLAQADAHQLEALADLILGTEPHLVVIEGPNVMSSPVRYPLAETGATVVLGHAVFTVCAVMVNDHRGDGIRAGRDLAGAVAAAVCDAEYERGGPLTESVHTLCLVTETALVNRAQERATLVGLTHAGSAA